MSTNVITFCEAGGGGNSKGLIVIFNGHHNLTELYMYIQVLLYVIM